MAKNKTRIMGLSGYIPAALAEVAVVTVLDMSEVRDVLGHASPLTTTQIYAHFTPKFLRDAVEKYSATPTELVAELDAEQRGDEQPRYEPTIERVLYSYLISIPAHRKAARERYTAYAVRGLDTCRVRREARIDWKGACPHRLAPPRGPPDK